MKALFHVSGQFGKTGRTTHQQKKPDINKLFSRLAEIDFF